MPKELFDIFASHPFDSDHCFLCGVCLDDTNRTAEHVFPKWLQDAFNIKDLTVRLLNGTYIQYRNLTIPCCKTCNGTHLSQLEALVRSVILDDSKSLSEISDQDLNAWVSKIYLGIHWKELELKFDRQTADSEKILQKNDMESFRTAHFFMQSCRKEMTFYGTEDRFPNTLMRIECKVPNAVEDQFDYLDSFIAHTVALRMGNKGVVALFDGGLHDLNFPNFAKTQFDERPLHPDQYREVFASLTYKSSLSLRVPYYGIIQDKEIDKYFVARLAFDDHNKGARCVIVGSEDGDLTSMYPVLPPSALDGPDYSEWSQEEFAHFISMYTGAPFEHLFVPPNLVRTSLRDDNGNFRDIPL
ncbi:hypothetical protein [Methylocella sp.]|uniref:hypothetical protein n=1 Tax=Methylocella sp. TaxID=1978226 RepID=UPI003C793DBD